MSPADDALQRREGWEQSYAAGKWEYLSGIEELAHYSVILGYAWYLQSNSILDVGCGEGVLTRILQAFPYEAYHGVDVSAHAIAAAEARYGNTKTRFFRADAEAFRPERCFDTIIFNKYLQGTFGGRFDHYDSTFTPACTMRSSCARPLAVAHSWNSAGESATGAPL